MDYDEFWNLIPAKALHPYRVPILEALRVVEKSLSAVGLVDLLDGRDITMWVAESHLRALAGLGVVAPDPKSRRAHDRGMSSTFPTG